MATNQGVHAAWVLVTLLPALAWGAHHQAARALPASFENNRIFLIPETAEGRVVRFVTDTGGGWNAIRKDVAEEIGLPTAEDGNTAALPLFSAGRGIPGNPLYAGGRLELVEQAEWGDSEDGFLGGRWFGDKVWEFDYPNRTLSELNGFRSQAETAAYAVDLGFQVNAQGARTMHFPRMHIEIEGRQISVLLDTGAKAQLTDSAADHFGEQPGASIGTSFIIRSLFDEWVERNPDWQVLADADSVRGTAYPMIEVPAVTIGKHTVGPVWFAVRPDSAFHEFMSSMMDDRVDGALGGSGLQYLRMILDYPGAKAYFFAN